jgi:hypothetical protein
MFFTSVSAAEISSAEAVSIVRPLDFKTSSILGPLPGRKASFKLPIRVVPSAGEATFLMLSKKPGVLLTVAAEEGA